MEIKSIKEIVGDNPNTFKKGTMIGVFKGLDKPNDYFKFVFVDATDNKQYSLTLFEDNKVHNVLKNSGKDINGFFKLQGSFKLTPNNFLNIGDDCIFSEPIESEIPKPVEDEAQKIQAISDVNYIKDVIEDKINDPVIKSLCNKMRELYGSEMTNTAGARHHHHAHRRGLIQHVVEMLKSGVVLGQSYDCSEYEMDLIIAGIIFHDIGKIWETHHKHGSPSPTLKGALLGHMVGGVFILLECADALGMQEEKYNNESILHLSHIILSHHGCNEWGSPEEPRTRVARIIHEVDNLSAKLNPLDRIKNDGINHGGGLYTNNRTTYVDITK